MKNVLFDFKDVYYLPKIVEIKLDADKPTNQYAASLRYALYILSLLPFPSSNDGGVPFI